MNSDEQRFHVDRMTRLRGAEPTWPGQNDVDWSRHGPVASLWPDYSAGCLVCRGCGAKYHVGEDIRLFLPGMDTVTGERYGWRPLDMVASWRLAHAQHR